MQNKIRKCTFRGKPSMGTGQCMWDSREAIISAGDHSPPFVRTSHCFTDTNMGVLTTGFTFLFSKLINIILWMLYPAPLADILLVWYIVHKYIYVSGICFSGISVSGICVSVFCLNLFMEINSSHRNNVLLFSSVLRNVVSKHVIFSDIYVANLWKNTFSFNSWTHEHVQ